MYRATKGPPPGPRRAFQTTVFLSLFPTNTCNEKRKDSLHTLALWQRGLKKQRYTLVSNWHVNDSGVAVRIAVGLAMIEAESTQIFSFEVNILQRFYLILFHSIFSLINICLRNLCSSFRLFLMRKNGWYLEWGGER